MYYLTLIYKDFTVGWAEDFTTKDDALTEAGVQMANDNTVLNCLIFGEDGSAEIVRGGKR